MWACVRSLNELSRKQTVKEDKEDFVWSMKQITFPLYHLAEMLAHGLAMLDSRLNLIQFVFRLVTSFEFM
jgi:hypothetical protein